MPHLHFSPGSVETKVRWGEK